LVFAFGIQYIDLNLDVADIAFDLNKESVKYSSAELCGKLAKKVAEKKVAKDWLQTFVKGIGCNWMVCMAVFLSGQAQDMVGKMVGIWFPISCFVAIGFEHIPANMYMIPLGLLAGADVTIWEVIWKNFIPTTLGNIFAGSIIVACGYSYSFGALGKPRKQKTAELPLSTPSDKGIDTPISGTDVKLDTHRNSSLLSASACPGFGSVTLETVARGAGQFLVECRTDDVDHPLRPMEPAPEVIVLAIGAAEESAEIVEFRAAQGSVRSPFADRGGIFGRDAIDLDRIEFGEILIAHQGQGGDVVIGEAEIGQ